MRRTGRVMLAGILGAAVFVSVDMAVAGSVDLAVGGAAGGVTAVRSVAPAGAWSTDAITGRPAAPAASPVTAATRPVVPTKKEIAELFREWNDTLATGRAIEVAKRYAPDAVLLPTMSNQVRDTREEIVDYFRHFLEYKPKGTIKKSTIRILGDGSAIDAGVYLFTLIEGRERRLVEARYTFVYERRDDVWLIVNHHSSVMPDSTR